MSRFSIWAPPPPIQSPLIANKQYSHTNNSQKILFAQLICCSNVFSSFSSFNKAATDAANASRAPLSLSLSAPWNSNVVVRPSITSNKIGNHKLFFVFVGSYTLWYILYRAKPPLPPPPSRFTWRHSTHIQHMY